MTVQRFLTLACRGAASGVDLDSDFIIELADHPNCMGTKLTCAGIGKGTRIAAHVQSKEYLARHGPFQVLPGFTDYLLPALVTGHTGCITGTGNVIPKTIVKLFDLSTKAIETGDQKLFKEAQQLQQIGNYIQVLVWFCDCLTAPLS